MRSKIRVTSSVLAATVLAVSGCSAEDTASTSAGTSTSGASSPAASGDATGSSSGQPDGSFTGGPPSGGGMPSGNGGPGGGGPGGGGGGVGQTFTAVNLNTDGASTGGANTADVVTAVNAFLATLTDEQRDTVEYDFTDNQARQTWSNYPSTAVPREGIVLSDLNADQQKAALAVLQVALSPEGYQQDVDIQAADDYLNSLGGQGADGFGGLVDYYFAIYGTPSTSEPFQVQFGGHHLARNLTYNGDNISQTPQFVGSEPTSFDVAGTTVAPVEAESTALYALFGGLTADQRTASELSGTFDDLLMGPGKDSGVFPASEGVLASDLSADQQAQVMATITTYAGDLPEAAATALIAKYRSELSQTSIGWANNTGATDESSYLRIDGPSVWIEFINTRSQSTPDIHYHSVYRDKTNDYGSSTPS